MAEGIADAPVVHATDQSGFEQHHSRRSFKTPDQRKRSAQNNGRYSRPLVKPNAAEQYPGCQLKQGMCHQGRASKANTRRSILGMAGVRCLG
jgi:hypothetical protein